MFAALDCGRWWSDAVRAGTAKYETATSNSGGLGAVFYHFIETTKDVIQKCIGLSYNSIYLDVLPSCFSSGTTYLIQNSAVTKGNGCGSCKRCSQAVSALSYNEHMRLRDTTKPSPSMNPWR